MSTLEVLQAAPLGDQAQVEIALITGVVAIITTVLGIFAARRLTHPKVPTTDPDEHRNRTESILATYSGDQNEFISLVIKDSRDLHARLDHLDGPGGVIDQMRKERVQFVSAVARYINKLTRAWGSGGKMPYPDTEDLAILEETLPADWRRRSTR